MRPGTPKRRKKSPRPARVRKLGYSHQDMEDEMPEDMGGRVDDLDMVVREIFARFRS
jgi:hypothetical protein